MYINIIHTYVTQLKKITNVTLDEKHAILIIKSMI